MNRRQTLTVVVVLIAATVAALPVQAVDGVVAIDADHQLDTDHAKQSFDNDGVVSTDLARLNMSVTVAKDHRDANISGWYADINNRYLCLNYQEDLQRTIRIYIPRDYFNPRVNAELESLTSKTTATAEPTADGDYTAIEATFNGPTRACFQFSRERGIYFDTKDKILDVVNNSTGIEIPRLGGSEQQWQYIEDPAWVNTSTVHIDDDGDSLTLQYDSAETPNDTEWLPVPECENPSEQRVCYYTKANSTGTYVMSTADDPPPVRYKQGTDILSSVESWAEDLSQIPGRLMDALNGLVGGGN